MAHSEETKLKISNALSKKIKFNCDMCGVECFDKPSSYARKKKHFCSSACYASYRKEVMSFFEQNSYKGVRAKDESRQVYHRNYCNNNKSTIAHLKSRRYAREKGAVGSHTLAEWCDLLISYGSRCAACASDKDLTKDHIIPLSKGGSDYIENIQPLCKSCNSRKGNKINQNPELLNG